MDVTIEDDNESYLDFNKVESLGPGPGLAPGQGLGPWLLSRGVGRGIMVLTDRLLSTLDRFVIVSVSLVIPNTAQLHLLTPGNSHHLTTLLTSIFLHHDDNPDDQLHFQFPSSLLSTDSNAM